MNFRKLKCYESIGNCIYFRVKGVLGGVVHNDNTT